MSSALARVGNAVVPRLGGRVLGATARTSHQVAERLHREQEHRRLAAQDDESWLGWAYQTVLHREPDPVGRAHWLTELRRGMKRDDLLQVLAATPEAHEGLLPREAMEAFHGGRVAWTRSLPRGARILDLGGTSLSSELGSLLILGYPYDFESLTIIELPSDDRHDLYKVGDHSPEIAFERGPIRYQYQSMVELGNIPDASVDLVVSGQTFEHITEAEGRTLLRHVARILAPGGHLALDTPNRAITEIQCATTGEEFINPDHEIEYTHAQMLEAFADSGLEVVRAHGIGYMPETARTRTWMIEELVHHPGLFDAIEESYTLAYLARRA